MKNTGLSYGNKLITYAQNLEDIILYGYFQDLDRPGFYVDIGANHPVHDSVTKFFSLRGWIGVNVEPIPHLCELLKKDRPLDVNVAVGIARQKGKSKIRKYKSDGLSTFSDNLHQSYGSQGLTYEEIEVELVPLSDLFKEHAKGRTIDFLKVDVEGFEFEVLASNKWSMFRPRVICVESTGSDTSWKTILKRAGYLLHIFDGLNEFYVAEESQELLDNYQRIVASGVIRNDIANLKTMRARALLRMFIHKISVANKN